MTKTPTTFTQTRWSLDDLFPAIDSPELEAAFSTLNQHARDFESLRPGLTSDITAGEFQSVISRLEDGSRLAHRISAYASLCFTQNTQDQKALSLLAHVDQATAEAANRTMFFSLWWKDLPDADADRLLETAGDYRYWLEKIRLFKPHTLTEAEEKIINIKDITGASALNTLYDSITNRYTFRLVVDAVEHDLTRGELMVYARHADPALREAAYKELYRVYAEDSPILGQIYQNLVRDWHNEQLDLRGFDSPIAVRNLANHVPDAVVDTLLDVCDRNAGTFQRYFKLKARLLGMEKLRRYDIYAPLSHSDRAFAFEDAVPLVMDAFSSFDPRMAELALRVPAETHLDSEVRKGKQGGAFCLTALPDLTPWVLLNYQGRADDVATMAHELGHAVHSMLAADHTLFTAHASLPLAETASTFGEMLLVDHLLAHMDDPALRRDLLFRQVDDAYATILRQAYFALFERQAHELVQSGASVDELAEAYLANLRQQFGDAVDLSDEFKWEWVSIPHIYGTPFYVYAYTFGQLLVLSLYSQYRAEGASFIPRYLKILSAGGSKPPAEILAEAGIDITQDSFWQGGFDVVAGMIDQLEKL